MSLPYDANQRTSSLSKAISEVKGNIVFKGFMGPTIKDDVSLPSLGIRAARSAGVIVDDLGKMRCPPGTPNANQFTDLQMSNCMVPSLETIAQQATDAAAKLANLSADGFKRGRTTDAVKAKDLTPIPHVGFHDDKGFTAQKRVIPGVTVTSPKDGSTRQLLELQDSVTHIAEGGKLTDIPDEHLLDAISINTGTKNTAEQMAIDEVFKNTGVRINGSEPKRFEVIGEGGGVNGMTRLKDGTTGALLGIKYQNGNGGGNFVDEPLNEAMAEVLSGHFGYEAMPMRITLGHEEVMRNTGVKWNKGVTLVSELAHNRYDGNIESGAIPDGGIDQTSTRSEELVRMALFDSVISNPDRHEQNMLFTTDETGKTSSLIPIDQSLAFAPGSSKADWEMPYWVKSLGGVMAVRLDLQAQRQNTIEGREEIVSHISKIQEELRSIDIEMMREQIDSTVAHYLALGGQMYSVRRNSIDDVFLRLENIKNADPEELMKMMMARYPEPKPPQPMSLDEWASAITSGNPEEFGKLDL